MGLKKKMALSWTVSIILITRPVEPRFTHCKHMVQTSFIFVAAHTTNIELVHIVHSKTLLSTNLQCSFTYGGLCLWAIQVHGRCSFTPAWSSVTNIMLLLREMPSWTSARYGAKGDFTVSHVVLTFFEKVWLMNSWNVLRFRAVPQIVHFSLDLLFSSHFLHSLIGLLILLIIPFLTSFLLLNSVPCFHIILLLLSHLSSVLPHSFPSTFAWHFENKPVRGVWFWFCCFFCR